MAQWIMAVTGFFALLVSIWAVWLLKRTLDASLRAVKEAESATKVAQDSVEVTRDTAERQLRAYVFPVLANINGLPDNPRVTVGFTNSGQTPAYDIRVRARRMLMPRANMQFNLEGAGVKRMGDIGPNGSHRSHWPIPEIMSAEVAQIKSGAIVFVIDGDYRYRDAFGTEQTTNFRFEMFGQNGLINQELDVCDDGNDAT